MDYKYSVSVVVTVHSSGDFLRTCLESLVAQSLKKIQIVCVNDASPDPRDEEILQEFSGKYENIVSIKNDLNQGTGFSRERGVSACEGEYIGFLDSDDFCEPFSYEMLYSHAKACDADIAVGDYLLTEVNSIQKTSEAPDPKMVRTEVLSGPNLFDRQINRIINPFYLRVDWWNKIYRRSLFSDNSYSFPHVTRNEGAASMIVSLLAKRAVIVDWQIFFTTARPESVSRRFKSKHISDTIESAIHFRSWLIKLGYYDQYRERFEVFYSHIILNHNITLISKEPPSDALNFLLEWREKIVESATVLAMLLRYCRMSGRHVERRALRNILREDWCYEHIFEVETSKVHPRTEGGYRVRRGSRPPRPNGPLVTVATITRNLVDGGRMAFFKSMMASLRNQDYERNNIEHIIIDGASTDSTLEELRGYDKKGEIDYLISEPDSGIYNAMNKAIRYSRGDYIVFMNSDDFFLPGAISSAVSAMTSEDVSVCFGNAIKVDENDKRVGSHIGDMRKVFYGSPYCHQTVFARRDCLLETPFPEDFKITMWAHALSLYLRGYKHVHLNQDMAAFRVGGVSTQVELEKFETEQLMVKHVIAEALGLSIEEFEYLNHTIRRRRVLQDVDTTKMIDTLEKSDTEFSRDFSYKTLSLVMSLPYVSLR